MDFTRSNRPADYGLKSQATERPLRSEECPRDSTNRGWFSTVFQAFDGDRCVDIFRRPEGTFGFEEFRKDPEDMGAWKSVSYFSAREYPSEVEATDAACQAVPWFAPLVARRSL